MSRSVRPAISVFLALAAMTMSACGDDGAPVASSPNTTPPSSPPSGVVDTTPVGMKASVLATLTGVEACRAAQGSYRRCDTPQAIEAVGAHIVKSRSPKPGEVAVTSATRDTLKIVGTDLAGTRYVLTKSRSGAIDRTCRSAAGEACAVPTW